MWEPKKNNLSKSSQIKERPLYPDVGGWKKGGKTAAGDVKKPGFER